MHLIREPGEDLRQDEWVTRMARLAATDFGADWVINSDADEFWWPRGTSSTRCSGPCPSATGRSGRSCACSSRVPGEGPFAERMTVRFSALAPINDPASLYKPIRKVVHRGHPEIRLTRGNHALVEQPVRAAPRLVPDRGVPLPAPLGGAVRAQGRAPGARLRETSSGRRRRTTRSMFEALRSGRIGEYYESLVVADASSTGRRVRAPRRRHAAARRAPARSPPVTSPDFPIPTLVEDAEYAVEAAVLGEADVVRLQRRLDELETPPADPRAAAADARLPQGVGDGEARARSLEV